MDQIFPFTGFYFWWILAGVLLLAELAMPGFFMLWLAVAAALTAMVDLAFNLSWKGEIFTFALLSFILVVSLWRVVIGSRNSKTDAPNLNQRQLNFIDHEYVLLAPIVNGSGKIRVEDALWDVDGPDMEAGKRVKVIGVNGMRLTVEAV